MSIKRSLAFACGMVSAAIALSPVVGTSPAHAAFPGANGKIAFASERDGNREIYVMNPDGSGLTRLTNNRPSARREPAWSPHGNKIAFSSARDGGREIYVMNADGTGADSVRLTTSTPAANFTTLLGIRPTRIVFSPAMVATAPPRSTS